MEYLTILTIITVVILSIVILKITSVLEDDIKKANKRRKEKQFNKWKNGIS